MLRKKPPPPTLPSAHAIEREYQVMAALGPTPVPVPRVVHLCEDPSVIGTPFYLMEHVKGKIFDDPALPGLSPAQRSAVYRSMATTLAALHSVVPREVGLQGYGAPAKYNSRQVVRWRRQYASSVSLGEDPMAEMVRLGELLAASVPSSDSDPGATRVCHGDYRMDNLVFDAGREDTVLAVLDWELSTLGDPLADLAYNCLPYHLPSAGLPSVVALPTPLPEGVPTEEQYVEMYCSARGINPPSPVDWPFYLSLSLFRLASILAGVGARAKQGNASSRVAGQMGADSVVRGMAQTALNIMSAAAAQVGRPGVPLVGTPFEPYANPTHSTASVDRNQILEGTPVEEYANPTQTWRVMSESGAIAAAEADVKLPPTVAASTASLRSSSASAAVSSGSRGRSAPECPGLGPSARVQPILEKLHRFMEERVYPSEAVLAAHAASDARWTVHPVQEELKEAAKAQGLWNLWIPSDMAQTLRTLVSDAARSPEQAALLLGPGLSNLEYAHCAEVMGRSVWASEAFNCSAPDTGNMEVLARYGSPEQQRTWLLPLLRGDIRSCFAMTEPAVASSDATNIQCSMRQQGGGGYLVNGLKWWISGATDPRCKVAIVMGKTDASAPPHRQQSMMVVPLTAPGVKVERPLPLFGFDDAPHGHAVVSFTNVSVGEDALILGEGRGFEIAQGRLGPGRLHHCMRLIGMGERAMQLMGARAASRVAFGRPLGGHQSVRLDIANSRVELDAARMTVLEAARCLDEVGNKAARGKIAAAKALTPSTVLRILDRAIQIHGGAGVSDETPLAAMWAGARTLRLADGPDVVHLETIAKLELGPLMRKAKM